MVSDHRVGEPQRRVRLRQPRVYRLAESLFADLRPGDLVYLRTYPASPIPFARRPAFRVADCPTLAPNTRGCFLLPSNHIHIFHPDHLHSVRFTGSRTRWTAIHA